MGTFPQAEDSAPEGLVKRIEANVLRLAAMTRGSETRLRAREHRSGSAASASPESRRSRYEPTAREDGFALVAVRAGRLARRRLSGGIS
jgi:hypothetical protein